MAFLEFLSCIPRREGGRRRSRAGAPDSGFSPSYSSVDIVGKEPSTRIHQTDHEQTCQTPQPLDAAYHDALIVTSKGQYEVIKLKSTSVIADSDVVISTKAVGLNPIDWKSVEFGFCLPEFPWVTGREVAGIVERVGSKVHNIKVGDRVWASTYYKKREAGCFQSRVISPAHAVLPIPANLSFEAAACLGVSALTAAMTLWLWLNVPIPSQEAILASSTLTPVIKDPNYLLIWGGSTVTGQFAIQLAVLSGFDVVTVTSTKTCALAAQLGAKHVITRDGKTNDQIATEIRSITGDTLTKAIDIVGPATAPFAMGALSKIRPSVIAPLAFMSKDALPPSNVTVEMVEMKRFVLDPTSRVYATELNRLIECGHVKIPNHEVLQGGLQEIPRGLELQKAGDLGGRKLIVRV